MNTRLKTLSVFGLAGGLLALTIGLSATPGSAEPTLPEAPLAFDPTPEPEVPEAQRPRVQIALLLDTSSSMDGLIDQAKSQLWKIVNQFSESDRNGVRPRLEIALFEYGNDRLSSAEGWIRMVTPFTSDLDGLSESLFALKTNGGTEHCGRAIEVATNRLDWADDPEALKLMFIAGNESFEQGDLKPPAAMHAAAKKGITVNTIFCGSEGSGVAMGWRSGAMIADGSFMFINHNQKVAHVAAPQDAEIAKLGAALNDTYIPFGRFGNEGSTRQAAQDSNAVAAKQGSATQRAVSKSSAYYDNSRWDLVDALTKNKVKLEEVEESALPAPMQKMNTSERKNYVKKQVERRRTIQKKIARLNKDRNAFATKAQKEAAGSATTFDSAMLDMVKKQATKKGYRF